MFKDVKEIICGVVSGPRECYRKPIFQSLSTVVYIIHTFLFHRNLTVVQAKKSKFRGGSRIIAKFSDRHPGFLLKLEGGKVQSQNTPKYRQTRKRQYQTLYKSWSKNDEA